MKVMGWLRNKFSKLNNKCVSVPGNNTCMLIIVGAAKKVVILVQLPVLMSLLISRRIFLKEQFRLQPSVTVYRITQ